MSDRTIKSNENLSVVISGEVDKDSPFDQDAIRAEIIYWNTSKNPSIWLNQSTVVLSFTYLSDLYESKLGKKINFDSVNYAELETFVLDAAESVYDNNAMLRSGSSQKGRIEGANGKLRYIPDVDARSTGH